LAILYRRRKPAWYCNGRTKALKRKMRKLQRFDVVLTVTKFYNLGRKLSDVATGQYKKFTLFRRGHNLSENREIRFFILIYWNTEIAVVFAVRSFHTTLRRIVQEVSVYELLIVLCSNHPFKYTCIGCSPNWLNILKVVSILNILVIRF